MENLSDIVGSRTDDTAITADNASFTWPIGSCISGHRWYSTAAEARRIALLLDDIVTANLPAATVDYHHQRNTTVEADDGHNDHDGTTRRDVVRTMNCPERGRTH